MSKSSCELESGIASTATERGETNDPTLPTAHSEKDEGEVTSSQLPASTDARPLATISHYNGNDLQHPVASSDSNSVNELGGEQSHQRTEVPFLGTSLQVDRDLERGEPSTPQSFASPVITDADREESHPGSIEATGSTVTEESQHLEQYLMSVLGERRYREYTMGFGTASHHGFLMDKIVSNIATWSSSRQTWPPLVLVATVLQQLVSRWVHSGYRKHFETFHPHLYDGTAVHLLQNIGSPSAHWINMTLRGNLGLDPLFLLEHLALICDGTLAGLASGLSSGERLPCTSAWHVRAILSDQPMLQFGPWSTTAPPGKATVATISFQQTRQGSFLILLDMKTDVSLGERLKESLRGRHTWKQILRSYESFFASKVGSRLQRRLGLAALFSTSNPFARLLNFLLMIPFRVIFMFLRSGLRPENVDRYGEVAIEWPNTKRSLFRRKLRPPQSSVFKFLKQWLSDPVHIKMLTHMTSDLAHDSNAFKAAEDCCIWLLNRADWKHEVRRLSTESELLERQAVERSNFNTLKRLVQCRRTTKNIKDGINKFRSYTPATPVDWTPIMQSWADQQQARSDQQRRQPDHVGPQQVDDSSFFPTLQAERNPIELLYWQRRTKKAFKPKGSADLTVEHVEDTLSRSLSLLQEAIAVQTSDRALWLALIATFYFPATLATGIFGMNLSLIDGKPYWWAIVICAILFVPNLAFLIYVFGRR